MQICAVVNYKENTLVVDMPRSFYDLYGKLQSIGVLQPPQDIRLTDREEDDLRVKIFGETEVGKHLTLLLTEEHSLADVNTLTFVYEQADERIQQALHESILADCYDSPDEFIANVRQLLQEHSDVTQSFYFPLTGHFEEYDDWFEADTVEIANHEIQIRALLERVQSPELGVVAQYMADDPAVTAKLISAVWDVEEHRGELYGVVRACLSESFTPEEKAAFKEMITGQNSDGLGESFEQRPIYTRDGELYVSMWHSGEDYFVYDEDEMDVFLQNQGMQMGGM